MNDVTTVINKCMAVWNEADTAIRLERICAFWTEDGATCHQLLDAHGYEVIAACITGAPEKWGRNGGVVFKARQNAVGRRNAVKFNWEMAPASGGALV